MATASDVLRIAAGEIGYTRWDDPQSGTKYGRWYAQDHGSYFGTNGVPFCAMFVSWVFAQAGQSMPGLPTASCSVIVASNRGTSRSVDVSDARAGDVVLFDWDPSAGNGADHVGIVESNGGSYLTTIEGNTSSGSSGSQGNGGGVWRRTRAYSTVYAVYRPDYSKEDDLTSEQAKMLQFIYDHMNWDEKTHFSDLGNLVAQMPITYGQGDGKTTAPIGDRLAYIDAHTHTVDAKMDEIMELVKDTMAKVDALSVLIPGDD